MQNGNCYGQCRLLQERFLAASEDKIIPNKLLTQRDRKLVIDYQISEIFRVILGDGLLKKNYISCSFKTLLDHLSGEKPLIIRGSKRNGVGHCYFFFQNFFYDSSWSHGGFFLFEDFKSAREAFLEHVRTNRIDLTHSQAQWFIEFS